MVSLLGLGAVLLTWHFAASLRWGSRPTELQHGLDYRVDLNQAERAELLQLPGVGPARVEAILKYRRAHGGFRTVDELRNIHGIGSTTLERLGPWVCVAIENPDKENDAQPEVAPRRRAFAKRKAAANNEAGGWKVGRKTAKHPQTKIDVNGATADELQQIPHVGPVLAGRIIEERRKRPFRSVEELKRVRGIKDIMIAHLRPYVTVGGK
jgi:competence protein ComEA